MEHAVINKNQNLHNVANELSHFLADTYTLYLKTQNFHWNVTGVNFYSLHKLFEEQYQELAAAVDEIAERIRALGCHTPASFSQFSQLSSIKEENEEISAEVMLQKLLSDHQTLSRLALEIIPKAQKVNDEGTADMLIERLTAHDKAAWMLKSSLR